MKSAVLLMTSLAVLIGKPLFAHAGQSSANEKSDADLHFNWIADRNITLPISGSAFAIPHNWAAILGDDARRLDAASNGLNSDNGYIEAVAGNLIPGEAGRLIQVDFEYIDSGYVSDGDWSDLNTGSLLQEVRDNTEKHNADMRKAGLGELHVLGWLQKPAFNSQNHVASWVIENSDQNGVHNINMTAIKLGRSGYERLIVIADRDNY